MEQGSLVLLQALFALLQESPSAEGFTAWLYQLWYPAKPRVPSKTPPGLGRERGPSQIRLHPSTSKAAKAGQRGRLKPSALWGPGTPSPWGLPHPQYRSLAPLALEPSSGFGAATARRFSGSTTNML